jgi:hypothetical protein
MLPLENLKKWLIVPEMSLSPKQTENIAAMAKSV